MFLYIFKIQIQIKHLNHLILFKNMSICILTKLIIFNNNLIQTINFIYCIFSNYIMNYIQAIIVAIVQGLTEWFPISSTAHLAIVARLANMDPNITYFALLHVATIISLLLYLRKGAINYIWNNKTKQIKMNAIYLIVATIPVFIVGFFLHDQIEYLFTNMRLMGVALIINAVILILSGLSLHHKDYNEDDIEFYTKTRKLTFSKAILVGLMQMFAIIPGISRSGITILGSIFAKMKNPDTNNREMLMFVLMLSVPAILGAGFYELMKAVFANSIVFSLPLLVGLIVCTMVGYASVHLLTHMIKKNLIWHWWFYSLVLGIVLLFN